MALITDPDNLSQGLDTAVTDAVWGTPTGAQVTITSAGSNLPTIAAGDFFEIRNHSNPVNNGLYLEDGGSPTAASITASKVEGSNPAAASSEAVNFLHDNATLSEEKSVMIDTGLKRIYLLEQGNLSADGVTGQVVYSFLKEEWKNDSALIPFKFPMVAVTPEQFELIEGWEFRDVSADSIRTKKLIRTAGWSAIDAADVLQRQYAGVVTLGTFEDSVNDKAYYHLGDDPTDTGAAVDFDFAGPVNEAILVYNNVTPADTGTGFAFTTNNTLTRNDGGNWITEGYAKGGQIEISNAEDAGNNGTFIIDTITSTVITTTGTPWTNNAADTTMTAAFDNRNNVRVKIRIRDADPNGKTFDGSDLAAIGQTSVDNKVFRFPLANATDLKISETDANIDANTPYTEIRPRYLDAAYNREVDSATKRDFGIVIDVGTYSQANGASAASTLFTSANLNLGAGEALADYAGGSLIIHEGTDQGTHTISGTPVDNAGTLEITLTAALTATESNLSFTMERATPLTATKEEIYEKIQRELRRDADIDQTGGVVVGRTADELLVFVGDTLKAGTLAPDNPNGGGSGVIIEGFDANDTNALAFVDNGGTERTFPFVAAGTLNFNANLVNDSMGQYWLFFEYTTRTTVSDMALSAASGDTASLDSAGANLPTLAQNDYINLQGFTDPNNNGIWIVTDASPTTSQADIRKVDGATVSNETGASRTLDENPIDSPDAIIVDNNAGTDIAGAIGSASIAFDFDYDNNVQGGRTAATDAAVVLRAIGLETAQQADTFGITITRAVGLSFSVTAGLERNYSNP